QPRALQTDAGPFIGAQLDTRDSARAAVGVCRSGRRFSRIYYQAQHRRKGFGESAPGNWWSAGPAGQPTFHRAAVVFLHATRNPRSLEADRINKMTEWLRIRNNTICVGK